MSSRVNDTKIKIMKKTWSLMAKKQGRGVRLQDIAKAAGVSRQAIYMYFGSRAGLLVETARFVDESLGLSDRIVPILGAQTAEDMIDELVLFWANYIPDIYGMAKALMRSLGDDSDAAMAWNDRMSEFYLKCTFVTQKIVKEDKLAEGWTEKEVADFMWTILAVSNWEHLTTERGWTHDQYIERVQQIIKRTVLRS